MNLGQELLQLTAPDVKCGIVYIRGSFTDSPDAILARAQRRQGGKSTFGLKLAMGSSPYKVATGAADEEGLLNFRHPYVEYPLTCEDSEEGKCALFSFVKDETVYQSSEPEEA